MKRLYMCLFCLTFFLSHRNTLSQDNSYIDPLIDTAPISNGTHLTFRRYYFISRLDRTMRLLLKLQSTHHLAFSRSLRPISFDLSLFNDKRIIRSLKRIQETRSLKPLFMVWDDFIAYKSLEDDIFIEDFSKEIFVITRTVLSSVEAQDNALDSMSLQQLTQPSANKTEQLLDAIDITTYALQKAIPFAHIREPNHHTSPLDLKTEVSTDEIALRFYYIKRLAKAVDIIRIHTSPEIYRSLPAMNHYKSAYICSLLRIMQETESSNAIMDLWPEIKEYKFIDNMKFVKEFITVIFITMRHIYKGTAGLDLISVVETNIEKIDIEDVLHAIDIMSDQFSNHAHLYNQYTPNTFGEWLQHFWWIPPLTIGSIAVRLAYYYYKHG